MAYQSMLKGAVAVLSIALLLGADQALAAPTLELSQLLDRIQRRQTTSAPNIPAQAINAQNGLAVTFIYTERHPNFTNTQPSSAVSNISNTMCDLLAYHDELDDFGDNITTAFQNTSRDLQALLEANIQDTCAWLRLIPEISSMGSGSCSGMEIPPTCEMDHLRFYCVVKRLAAVENSVLNALLASINELYNEGNATPIPARHCSWINSKVPELKPQLDSLFC